MAPTFVRVPRRLSGLIVLGLCGLGWGAGAAAGEPATGAPLASAQLGADVSGLETPIRWGAGVVRQKPEWYASAEARAIADSVI
jgi:hypothetical protein